MESIPINSDSDISYTESDLDINYVTVVAMYFHLNQSKHSTEKYDNWTSQFLQSVSSPVVMYTDYISREKILKKRYPFPIHLILVDNIWQVMSQLEKDRNKSYIDNYLKVQIEIDPEKEVHNSNLYAIWNLKSFMVKNVIKKNPFNSSFFIYADAGAWRESNTWMAKY